MDQFPNGIKYFKSLYKYVLKLLYTRIKPEYALIIRMYIYFGEDKLYKCYLCEFRKL
jgi:hypothetical protein